jgi:hypothetical protein
MLMSTERELGEHSVAIDHMQKDMDEMKDDIRHLKIAVDNIEHMLSEIKGGKKAAMWLCGFMGSVATMLAYWWAGK